MHSNKAIFGIQQMQLSKTIKLTLQVFLIFSSVTALCRAYSAYAQVKYTPVKSTEKQADDKTKWATIDAVGWSYSEKTGEHTGTNFVYKEEDTTVTGAKLRYNDKKDILDAEGSLTLEDSKHTATGNKAHIENGKKKLATITGNVVITLKPDPQESTAKSATTTVSPKETAPGTSKIDVKTEVKTAPITPPTETDTSEGKNSVHKTRSEGGTVTCDTVEDYYRRKFVIMRGHLVFKQKVKKKSGEMVERTLTAEHAEYNGKKEEMELFAPVESHDTDGQELHFEKNVIVGTKEGEESLQSKGKVKFKVKVDESDDEPEPDLKPTKK